MKFFQNIRKPRGSDGKITVAAMNTGSHTALSKWGLAQKQEIGIWNRFPINYGGRYNGESNAALV